MIFNQTRVHGACTIDLEPHSDDRGFFARVWCHKEFENRGLRSELAQVNVSSNRLRGTLRGMHFQVAPFQEAKVIACLRGALFDVVLDLRPDSPTYLQWASAELTADNRRMLYVPPGCAHGFQTLADDTDLLYLISEFHSPAHARGVRFDDEAFRIEWPLPVSIISDRDRMWPDFQP
jgi:dTDP-4-dehydrorhamnose 3,5-epimerase